MNRFLVKARPADFEEFGHQTMLECGDEARALRICGLHLQAYEDELQPELRRRDSEMVEIKNQASALHSHLYDRAVPVNDARMLSHALKTRILLFLTVLAAIACLVGNMTTFYLLGFGFLLTFFSGAGMTALPLVVGHLAYEWIMSTSKWLQILAVLVAVALTCGGILMVGQARRDMVDRAASTPITSSYVDGVDTQNDQAAQEPKSEEGSESKIHQTLGKGMLLIMIAAELALGFLVGLLVRMHTDEDYAAWRKVKALAELLIAVEERVSELITLPEMAKKRCLAGILRAQNVRNRRHPPYHRALTMLVLLMLIAARASQAQTIERYEGILIDTSGSISRGGTTNELFHEYLIATKKLLLTEPPNSRVCVSSISTDSFGGTREILKGWTPGSRGVFTDDLNRARRQLASSFEVKSSGMAPVASGTDIFGGLWHLKALFESGLKFDASQSTPKTIWIFSDMMNETKGFRMPDMIDLGPKEMLARAKADGLVVPLNGYRIYIYGASASGLTPLAWVTVKEFWTEYFSAAGADLISYSGECNTDR